MAGNIISITLQFIAPDAATATQVEANIRNAFADAYPSLNRDTEGNLDPLHTIERQLPLHIRDITRAWALVQAANNAVEVEGANFDTLYDNLQFLVNSQNT